MEEEEEEKSHFFFSYLPAGFAGTSLELSCRRSERKNKKRKKRRRRGEEEEKKEEEDSFSFSESGRVSRARISQQSVSPSFVVVSSGSSLAHSLPAISLSLTPCHLIR